MPIRFVSPKQWPQLLHSLSIAGFKGKAEQNRPLVSSPSFLLCKSSLCLFELWFLGLYRGTGSRTLMDKKSEDAQHIHGTVGPPCLKVPHLWVLYPWIQGPTVSSSFFNGQQLALETSKRFSSEDYLWPHFVLHAAFEIFGWYWLFFSIYLPLWWLCDIVPCHMNLGYSFSGTCWKSNRKVSITSELFLS